MYSYILRRWAARELLIIKISEYGLEGQASLLGNVDGGDSKNGASGCTFSHFYFKIGGLA
jgi:hypothetical protein